MTRRDHRQAAGPHCQPARVVHAHGLTRDQLRELMAAHGQALAAGGKSVLKDGRRSAVTRVRCGQEQLCVKEYRPTRWLDRLKDVLRGSRARRAWRGAQRLAVCGISAPEALGLLEQDARSYLVTRFVDGAEPLSKLLLGRFAQPEEPTQVAARRELARQLGSWLRTVHDARIYHDDWSAKNFLAAESDGSWAFYLLDFESVSACKRLTRRRRVKNLGQLCDAPGGASSTDRMRFLLAYAAGDRRLTRGSFPRDVLASARRRAEARRRTLEKARERERRRVAPGSGD